MWWSEFPSEPFGIQFFGLLYFFPPCLDFLQVFFDFFLKNAVMLFGNFRIWSQLPSARRGRLPHSFAPLFFFPSEPLRSDVLSLSAPLRARPFFTSLPGIGVPVPIE